MEGPFEWRCSPPTRLGTPSTRGPGFRSAQDLRLEITLTPDGEATSYRHAISYRPALGPLGRLIDAVVAPSLRRDGRRTVERLKALAEAPP